jgi:hypothetical protein
MLSSSSFSHPPTASIFFLNSNQGKKIAMRSFLSFASLPWLFCECLPFQSAFSEATGYKSQCSCLRPLSMATEMVESSSQVPLVRCRIYMPENSLDRGRCHVCDVRDCSVAMKALETITHGKVFQTKCDISIHDHRKTFPVCQEKFGNCRILDQQCRV